MQLLQVEQTPATDALIDTNTCFPCFSSTSSLEEAGIMPACYLHAQQHSLQHRQQTTSWTSSSLCLACFQTLLQAVADGSLVTLVQRLRSQPQIITAYARDALIRDAAAADRLVAELQQLQVISKQ
jgi:hypothetical protein